MRSNPDRLIFLNHAAQLPYKMTIRRTTLEDRRMIPHLVRSKRSTPLKVERPVGRRVLHRASSNGRRLKEGYDDALIIQHRAYYIIIWISSFTLFLVFRNVAQVVFNSFLGLQLSKLCTTIQPLFFETYYIGYDNHMRLLHYIQFSALLST